MSAQALPFFIPHRVLAGREIAQMAGLTSPNIDFMISAVAPLGESLPILLRNIRSLTRTNHFLQRWCILPLSLASLQ